MIIKNSIKKISLDLNNFNNLRRYFDHISAKKYILFLFLIQLFAYYISYKNLFTYLGCTENITRYFIIHDFYFELYYPKMCDEQYYFYGFEFIDKIYVDDYVYQDRPLYLLSGFIVFKVLYFFNPLFQIENLSLLLLTSLILQILIVNMTAFLITKLINNKFEKFYFILFFLVTLFSFEERFYFFLPSNSNIYFLIFLFSIYSIKNNRLSGFTYGVLFTISGYGVIGFLYQLMLKIVNLKKSFKLIIKNILFFMIPTTAFECYRLLLGYFQGQEYGVKYIYNAEVYNQFVWFLKTLFINDYSSDLDCQSIPDYIVCYWSETKFFFTAQAFYLLILLMAVVLLKNRDIFYSQAKPVILFTLFSYFFLSFQGLYAFRFIYYSFGFCFILLLCYLVQYLNNDLIGLLIVILYSHYTITRNDWPQYNLLLSPFEYFLIVVIFVIVILNIRDRSTTAERVSTI